MKCAVLCNGPSRVAYKENIKYDFVIGCNIPWTKVDATIIVDEEVVNVWAKQPTLIGVPAYFSKKAWMHTSTIRKRDLFQPYFADLIKYEPDKFHSSGHCAVEVALSKGYTEIDIYGCDSWFKYTCDTYTKAYVARGPNEEIRMKSKVDGWRKRWNKIIDNHPNVTLNFIKHEDIH